MPRDRTEKGHLKKGELLDNAMGPFSMPDHQGKAEVLHAIQSQSTPKEVEKVRLRRSRARGRRERSWR